MAELSWTDLIVPNGGIDETRHPQKIEETKWSAASDVEALPDGVRRRNGSASQLSGALANTITGIIDYRKADAVTTALLLLSGGRIYKSVAGFPSEVTGALTSAVTFSDNILPSWTLGADKVFVTNGFEIARKYYRHDINDRWENMGLAAPTADITVTAGGSGGTLATATWYVDYYYWNNDIGVASNRRYQGIGAPFDSLTNPEILTINGLPGAVSRLGDRATHVRLEARQSTDTVFRLIKEIPITDTSTTISADTRTVEAEYDHAVAPVHKINHVAENRQFILNITDAPYRLMFSAIVGTTAHFESFPETNFRDFGRGDGDYGTALAFIAPRLLVVGMKNSLYAIDARRPGTSDVQTIAKNIGIASHRSLIVVGQRLYFLSDAKENKGMFMWTPGGEPQLIMGIDDTFKALAQTRLNLSSSVHYAPGDNRFQWWTMVSGPAASQHNRILVYDYLLNAWMVWTKPTGRQLAVLNTVVDGLGQARVHGGGYNGQMYLQDSGTTDAGTGYEGNLTMKVFDFGAAAVVKQHRYVDYLLELQATGVITLSMRRDYGLKSNLATSLQQMSTAGAAFTLGTSVLGGSATLGTGADRKRRQALRGRGTTFRPMLSGTSGWFLKGIAFGVQPLGTRRAD